MLQETLEVDQAKTLLKGWEIPEDEFESLAVSALLFLRPFFYPVLNCISFSK